MEILHISDTKKRTIYQFSKTGKYINEHIGINRVSTTLDISSKGISECLNFRRKSCGGYFWSFDRFPLYDTRHGFVKLREYNDKRIYQFDDEWNFVRQFKDLSFVSQTLGLSEVSLIYNLNFSDDLLKGHHYSYERFPHFCKEERPLKNTNSRKGVRQFTKEGEFIARFDSLRQAGMQLNLNPNSISMVCNNKQKTCGGYTFSFV